MGRALGLNQLSLKMACNPGSVSGLVAQLLEPLKLQASKLKHNHIKSGERQTFWEYCKANYLRIMKFKEYEQKIVLSFNFGNIKKICRFDSCYLVQLGRQHERHLWDLPGIKAQVRSNLNSQNLPFAHFNLRNQQIMKMQLTECQ